MLWGSTLTLMGVVLAYNLVTLWIEYLEYPAARNTAMIQESLLVFPAITVCNSSPVKRSALMELVLSHKRRKRAAHSDGNSQAENEKSKADDLVIVKKEKHKRLKRSAGRWNYNCDV